MKVDDRIIYHGSHEILEITPTKNNVHCFEAVETFGLLDVIAPPYKPGERDCIYYEPFKVKENGRPSSSPAYFSPFVTTTKLLIPCNPDFECYRYLFRLS
jgi:hypothetical protein